MNGPDVQDTKYVVVYSYENCLQGDLTQPVWHKQLNGFRFEVKVIHDEKSFDV